MTFDNKKITFIALLLSLFLIYGCGTKAEKTADKNITRTVDNNSFKSTGQISFTTTDINIGLTGEIVTIDSFLILSNMKGPKALSIIDLKQKKLVKNIIDRGDEKGNCISIASIIPIANSNTFWAYDATLSKMIEVNLQEVLKSPDYQPQNELYLRGAVKSVKSPVWINDSLFAACAYSVDNCRFIRFNQNCKITDRIGSLPSPMPEWPAKDTGSYFKTNAMAYSANMKKQPHGSKLVVAYTTSDRLEIYNNNKLEKIVRGPDFFDPVYSFKDSGFDQNVPLINKETNFAHMQVIATDKYIYTLYSGKRSYNTCGSRILMFDWNGNAIKSLNLKKNFCTIAVSESGKGSTLYTIDPETGNLAFTNIMH